MGADRRIVRDLPILLMHRGRHGFHATYTTVTLAAALPLPTQSHGVSACAGTRGLFESGLC